MGSNSLTKKGKQSKSPCRKSNVGVQDLKAIIIPDCFLTNISRPTATESFGQNVHLQIIISVKFLPMADFYSRAHNLFDASATTNIWPGVAVRTNK